MFVLWGIDERINYGGGGVHPIFETRNLTSHYWIDKLKSMCVISIFENEPKTVQVHS